MTLSSGLITGSYCNYEDVYDRMLIQDDTYDTSIEAAAIEAYDLVNVFLKPYVTVPLSSVDSNIRYICADFASSIFKRRMTPNEVSIRGTLQPDMINDMDGTGWFGLGIRKLEQYIKNYYVLAEEIGTTTRNPDMYLKLFKQGLITGTEFRNLVNSATNSVIEEAKSIIIANTETNTISNTLTDVISKDITKVERDTESLNKTLIENDTVGKTLTTNETENRIATDRETVNKVLNSTTIDVESNTVLNTKREYVTKKQSSFSFVAGAKDAYGNVIEGYTEDS